MASEQHINLLRQGFEVWNLWRQENPQIIPELKGADLTKLNLFKVDLSKTDLSEVNFSGTSLYSANLSRANLYKSNLCRADLRNSDLSGANLSQVSLKYVKLHHARIQEAIISEKWYLVWDVLNNGAEGRDLSGVDLSEADLSVANFKNANLSGSNLSNSILNNSNFSWADFSRANLAGANFSGANCDWADFSEANLGGVLINCYGASFSHTSFRQINVSSDSLNEFKQQVENFIANISQEYSLGLPNFAYSIKNKKEFFDNLLDWKNQESFNESIQKLLSSSKKGFIPGILLYTDEDEKLSVYVREHFDALDKLTGDWCTIYLLENPSPKWRKANQNWKKMIENSFPLKWFRSKPYDKSEAYDIARELGVDVAALPCLVLISPANLSEKLILPIREISTEYFRQLFSTIEKLVKSIVSEKPREKEANSQVFDHLKLNFREIVNFLEKNASQKQENNTTKYILKGDSIFVSIEPVSIGNINYNEKIEGNCVQGDYTDQSRSFTLGNIGGDFKPIGSPLIADGFIASGTVAESISIEQDIPKVTGIQNQQDKEHPSKTSKSYESKSIGRFIGVIIMIALFSGLAVYVFLQLVSSKHPVSRPSQEQRIKEEAVH